MTVGLEPSTTSAYRRGARDAAKEAERKGYRIELIDAAGFYDALGIAQRKMYDDAFDATAPYVSAHMQEVGYKKVYL